MAFGCGSLLEYSHLESAPGQFKASLLEKFPNINTERLFEVISANLVGYKKDFVCKDIHYRGKLEDPGITFGLDACEESSASGGILVTDLAELGLSPDEYVDFIVYYFEEFANREFPPNMPIYTFDFLPVETDNGQTVFSLSCVADEKGPLYVGHWSLKERAAIIATARGPAFKPGTDEPKSKGMMTDLDYLRTVMDTSIKNGVAIEAHVFDLYYAAILARRDLEDSELATLKDLEVDGAHSDVIEFKLPNDLQARFDTQTDAVSIDAYARYPDELSYHIS